MLPLLITVFLVVALVAFYLRSIRGIIETSVNCDGMRQVQIAAGKHQWRWPGDMHRFAAGKSWLKDIGMLNLILFQRIYRDTSSIKPLIAASFITHGLAMILLYLLLAAPFGPWIGLGLIALIGPSIWASIACLNGGFQPLSVLVTLLVWLIAVTAEGTPSATVGFILLVLMGMLFGLLPLTSASGRKLFPLVACALLFALRRHTEPLWQTSDPVAELLTGPVGIGGIGVLISGSLALVAFWVAFRPIVSALHKGIGPQWLVPHLFKARFPVGTYLARRDGMFRRLVVIWIWIAGYIALCLLFSRAPQFYLGQVLFLMSATVTFLFFMFPGAVENIHGFLGYWTGYRKYNHISPYKNHSMMKGLAPLGDSPRTGTVCLPRVFWIIDPFLTGILALSAVVLIISAIRTPATADEVVYMALVALVPLFWAEATRSPMIARSYLPVVPSLLLLPGKAWVDAPVTLGVAPQAVTAVAVVLILGSVSWNIYKYCSDLLPARMAFTKFLAELQRRQVRCLYYFETCFNVGILGGLSSRLQDHVEPISISSIAEVEDGLILIPPTSAKSAAVEGQQEAIQNGDFRQDGTLNELLDNRRIVDAAVASFSTLGSSRLWALDTEVTLFREMIVGDITARDRWLGTAWLVDAAKAHEILANSSKGFPKS